MMSGNLTLELVTVAAFRVSTVSCFSIHIKIWVYSYFEACLISIKYHFDDSKDTDVLSLNFFGFIAL